VERKLGTNDAVRLEPKRVGAQKSSRSVSPQAKLSSKGPSVSATSRTLSCSAVSLLRSDSVIRVRHNDLGQQSSGGSYPPLGFLGRADLFKLVEKTLGVFAFKYRSRFDGPSHDLG